MHNLLGDAPASRIGQKIWRIYRRHPLWNTSILLVSVLTTCQLSEPYSRTDFTLLLHLCFKAVLFWSPYGTKLWEGPLSLYPALLWCLLMPRCPYWWDQPRQVKSSTNSSGFSLTGMGAVGMELTHITELNLSGRVVQPVTFSLCAIRSSAKSVSSSWKNSVHWMPLCLSAVVLAVMIQSMASRKRIGEMMHPCLPPDCTEHHTNIITYALWKQHIVEQLTQ